jgi:hypothetical protein
LLTLAFFFQQEQMSRADFDVCCERIDPLNMGYFTFVVAILFSVLTGAVFHSTLYARNGFVHVRTVVSKQK